VGRRPLRSHNLPDRKSHPFRIPQNIAVSEPKYAIPQRFNRLRPRCIGIQQHFMAEPVDLDDQHQLAAKEIRKMWPDRHLPAELGAQLRLREISPKAAFRWCRLSPQFPRALCVTGLEGRHNARVPTPNPSRKREGDSVAESEQVPGGTPYAALQFPSRLREGLGVGQQRSDLNLRAPLTKQTK
jgi:hypothetical protein